MKQESCLLEVSRSSGALQFEILPSDSAYTNQVFLRTGTGVIFLGNNTSAGLVISISDPSALGLTPGEEFVLGIHVINTGNDFGMGGGYNNPDGIVHAAVDYLYNHVTIMGLKIYLAG